MFTIDTESGFQRRRLHHLELRPRRDGGAGRRESRRVLRAQADAARRQAGDHPPQPRLQADQDGVRHRRGQGRERQARCSTVDTAHRAAQPLFADRRRRDRTAALRADHRAALRPADGHRVGQGRRRRQALHPAGAPGDGEEPGGGQGRAALQAQGQAARCSPKAARSARRSAPARCASCTASPTWNACSPATCSSPT